MARQMDIGSLGVIEGEIYGKMDALDIKEEDMGRKREITFGDAVRVFLEINTR